ncbi:MAG: four-carbon acid sugar kinase family protein [Lentimonas sp.]
MKLVILDDDPTGTQAVHSLEILTVWDVPTLRDALSDERPAFFILTNSRAMPPKDARVLNKTIAANLKEAAGDIPVTVVSRSDSTLRGHFPLETDVLNETLGPFHATLLIPYFEAGGRITIDDVHYVREGDQLTPAAETPFAKDKAFGYSHSNLRDYVVEKTAGRVSRGEVISISNGLSPEATAAQLVQAPQGSYVVVSIANPAELGSFREGLRLAEAQSKRFLFRTAADFIPAYIGQERKPLLDHSALERGSNGGLIVAGSYVPKTTQQLEQLRKDPTIKVLELSVPNLLNEQRVLTLQSAAKRLHQELTTGQDVLLMTSRELITSDNPTESLHIGESISTALVELVQTLEVKPAWLIAKGGITSSDIATKALGIRRAEVLGQLLPGVPVWSADAGSKFPNLPYILFPGNVGTADSLREAVEKAKETPRRSSS